MDQSAVGLRSGPMHSILKHAQVIETKPYPHVIIHDAMDCYDELAATRPSLETIANGREYAENQRIDLGSPAALKMPNLPPIWRDFIEYHTSPQFWHDICRCFGGPIATMYPKLNPYKKPQDTTKPPQVQVRCAIGVNAPTTKEGSVRGPHIDSVNELVAGLLYMPLPEDDAGGDFEIHELLAYPQFRYESELLDGLSRRVKTVPYKANTLVMFVNSPHSIHAVTPRKPTKLERRIVSFAIDTNHELFPIYGPPHLVGRPECQSPKPA